METYNPCFTCKLVFIFADNDESGRAYADYIAAGIKKYAYCVRIVYFPDLPDKGDVSDYLQIRSAADLEALIVAAPEWTSPGPDPNSTIVATSGLAETNFKLVMLGELLSHPEVEVNYLVDQFGGGGIVTVISYAIMNPLDRIRNAAANLVQIQIAYVSYCKQLNMLDSSIKDHISPADAVKFSSELRKGAIETIVAVQGIVGKVAERKPN